MSEYASHENIEQETIEKVVSEISKNHHKIIDDWCKAYLSQLYEEGKPIKPGSFTLFEQIDLVIEDGRHVKKYWFEPRQD